MNTDSNFHRIRLTGAWRMLSFVLLLMLSVAIHAQTTTGTTANGLVYTTTNNQVSIIGYTGTGGPVTIPATIGYNPIVSIGNNAFYGITTITSVTAPGSVTSIGDYAFFRCTGLTSLPIPNGVKSIGTYAFYNCNGYNMTSVAIPSSVTSIADMAFGSCTRLTSIAVDAQNPNFSSVAGILFDKNQQKLIQYPGGLAGSYTIPNSVTSIGNDAFYASISLTSVIMPSSVTSIGDYVFGYCSNLTSITVDAQNPNFSSSGGVLFDKSQQLLIQYPGGLTGGYTIPNSVANIGNSAFYACAGLTSVKIPGSVTNIGYYAFYSCTGLTKAEFTGNAPVMGSNVFYAAAGGFTVFYFANTSGFSAPTWNGYASTAVSTPPVVSGGSTTATVGAAFSYQIIATGIATSYSATPLAPGLSCNTYNGIISGTPTGTGTFNVGLAVTNGYGTRTGSLSLIVPCPYSYTSSSNTISITGYTGNGGALIIPLTINGIPVTSIGASAFYNCTSLTSVTIPTNVTSINSSAFLGCTSLTSVTIPGSVTSIGDKAFDQCSGLTSVTIPGSVASIGSNAFLFCTGLTSVTIQNGVTSIGSFAFDSCTALTSITFPGSVTSIGDWAFLGCSRLASVMIPSSVTSIGTGSFAPCIRLTSITVDAQNPNYSSVGGILFDKSQQLLIQYPGGLTGGYTIPNSVTSIGSLAFYSCTALTSAVIPSSVTSIGDNAFYGCTKLTKAEFAGNAPTMGTNVFYAAAGGFTVYFYNDKSGFTSPTWKGYTAVNRGNSPVAVWLVSKGLPYNANLQSIPNNDGVPLLMAYAMNLDPTRNQSGNMPKPVFSENQISLSFYAGSVGVTYIVQSSSDLQTWSTSGVTVSALDTNNFCTATVPVTGTSCFMRIKVVY